MALLDRLIFMPTRYPDGLWAVAALPVRHGGIAPRIEDVTFVAEDGVRLHGWLATPERGDGDRRVPLDAPATLLWLHGNAGNLSHRYDLMRAFMTLPVRVFIIDYRGFGRSEGVPTEEGVYRDARAAWRHLVEERGASAERIVLFGKSLGGAVAIELATHVRPAGLVIQSTFTSLADVAASIVPVLPHLLLAGRFDSLARIGAVHCPMLFVHSPADEVVPYRLGRRLFEAAAGRKRFVVLPPVGHNDPLAAGQPYLDALREFIGACTRAS